MKFLVRVVLVSLILTTTTLPLSAQDRRVLLPLVGSSPATVALCFEQRHVLFQRDDRQSYIQRLLHFLAKL